MYWISTLKKQGSTRKSKEVYNDPEEDTEGEYRGGLSATGMKQMRARSSIRLLEDVDGDFTSLPISDDGGGDRVGGDAIGSAE